MAYLRKRMIEGKIISDLFRGSALEGEPVLLLFDIHSLGANRADETRPAFFPMEDLAAIKRLLQIEIVCGKLQATHSENVQRPTSNVQR
jgi:hypothetical protein